jgi:hypothetical protein
VTGRSGASVPPPLAVRIPPKHARRARQDPSSQRHHPPEPIPVQSPTPPPQTPRAFLAQIKAANPLPSAILSHSPPQSSLATAQELAELSGSPLPESELVSIGDQVGRGESCRRCRRPSPSFLPLSASPGSPLDNPRRFLHPELAEDDDIAELDCRTHGSPRDFAVARSSPLPHPHFVAAPLRPCRHHHRSQPPSAALGELSLSLPGKLGFPPPPIFLA